MRWNPSISSSKIEDFRKAMEIAAFCPQMPAS